MGILYTISPFIYADALPNIATIESVVSDHFYLFNIYSTNPYKVLNYMSFIDANFHMVFSNLDYHMIHYEFPDGLDESEMIRYINYHYNLSDQFELDRCYHMNIFEEVDYISKTTYCISFNDYALNDLRLYNYNLLCNDDDEILLNTDYLVRFLNSEYRFLSEIIDKMMEYQGAIVSSVADYSSVDEELTYEGTFTLYQLKKFVEYTVEERRGF